MTFTRIAENTAIEHIPGDTLIKGRTYCCEVETADRLGFYHQCDREAWQCTLRQFELQGHESRYICTFHAEREISRGAKDLRPATAL